MAELLLERAPRLLGVTRMKTALAVGQTTEYIALFNGHICSCGHPPSDESLAQEQQRCWLDRDGPPRPTATARVSAFVAREPGKRADEGPRFGASRGDCWHRPGQRDLSLVGPLWASHPAPSTPIPQASTNAIRVRALPGVGWPRTSESIAQRLVAARSRPAQEVMGCRGRSMVPALGLEPRCPCGRGILSPLRLPFRQAGADGSLPKRRRFVTRPCRAAAEVRASACWRRPSRGRACGWCRWRR